MSVMTRSGRAERSAGGTAEGALPRLACTGRAVSTMAKLTTQAAAAGGGMFVPLRLVQCFIAEPPCAENMKQGRLLTRETCEAEQGRERGSTTPGHVTLEALDCRARMRITSFLQQSGRCEIMAGATMAAKRPGASARSRSTPGGPGSRSVTDEHTIALSRENVKKSVCRPGLQGASRQGLSTAGRRAARAAVTVSLPRRPTERGCRP